jgi:hypothetical protein
MKTTLVAIGLLALAAAAPEAQAFESRRVPTAPGERRASVVVPLSGFPRSRVQVWLHYSTNQADLNNSGTVPKGRASCRTISNDRLRCEFLFPHADHPTPNILTRTELDGGEPPNERPTITDYQLALTQFVSGIGAVPPYVITDSNPKRIGAPDRVYYRWVKIVTGSGGSTTNDSIFNFVMARRFIVVNLGDSYASGEGTPNREFTEVSNEAMWEDTPCHRSEESGQERGVRAVIRRRPDVAVTFANFACSGAVTTHLTNATQFISPNVAMDPFNRRTPNGTVSRQPQLDRLEQWMQSNNRSHVDLMLLSIGGNNAGFGPVAKACLIDNLASECRTDPNVLSLISTGLSTLRGALEALKTDIDSRPFQVHRVVQFGYPDPTRDSNGAFCSPSVPATQTCWGPLERGVSQADFRFIHDSLLAPLNSTIAQFAADTPNWVFSATAPLSVTRGLCNCANGFFNTPGQSMAVQGDLLGSVHPNSRGHRNMYQPLTQAALENRINLLFAQAAQ